MVPPMAAPHIPRSAFRRTLAMAAIAAVLMSLVSVLPPPTAAAAAAPGCPAGTSPFDDAAGSFAQSDIACIYRLGITKGTSRSTYSPRDTVTRRQMAAFLARLWRASGNTCPTEVIPFVDVPPNSPVRADVACIYGLHVTKGTSPSTYDPNGPVTREQMGAFLARLWEATGIPCPVGGSQFTDVSPTSFAARSITCLRNLGIATGTGHGRYSPHLPVTREQMAAFLARFWRKRGFVPGPTVVPIRPHLAPPGNLPTTPGASFFFEGVWSPRGPLIDGYHGVYTTLVRPSPTQPAIYVLEAWIDPMLTNVELFPGSQRPGGRWAQPNFVPPERCQNLIFAGNGGFKMTQSRGGYYSEGREAVPLRDGAASFVIFADHRVDIVQWGRDIAGADLPAIASVRQNLELLVDNGAVVHDIDSHVSSRDAGNYAQPIWWGWLVANSTWTWRSGWGVTKDGAIIYVGGPGLKVHDLANRLVDAGAVRAMEGDINPYWITGNFYSTDTDGTCRGEKGLPQPLDAGGFRRPGSRYLSPDSSDFIAVFADHSRWVP